MLNLNPAAIPVVAHDTRAAIQASDQALRANAQMLVSIIDGADGSDLPIHVTQDIYASITSASGSIVESREKLRRSVTLLTAVKNRSNQRELATGCPGGLPEAEMMRAPQVPAAA
jgi:hypothetical protein